MFSNGSRKEVLGFRRKKGYGFMNLWDHAIAFLLQGRQTKPSIPPQIGHGSLRSGMITSQTWDWFPKLGFEEPGGPSPVHSNHFRWKNSRQATLATDEECGSGFDQTQAVNECTSLAKLFAAPR
ncbi:hypothetical protein CVT26_011504 [Gymnopilus dilepis]|uniref:Uncharacterized protein n=1 Tax=Gymnopilus dilepis TaxID=231916 RepID=A0A409WSK1_9AGAR|nr:hypothetical protein CVT26_011504 [Gymnopilus dilepis]